MNYTHIGKADLNLLLRFQTLIEERSITRAAHKMFLSEPAMSRAFDRLQDMLNDELLVRTKKGYEPTKKAIVLYRELTHLLSEIDQVLRGRKFSPAETIDQFRVAVGPYASVWFVPALVESLVRQAPKAQVQISALDRGFRRLETNDVDLVITAQEAPADLRSSILLVEPWVCLVRKNHPLTTRRLTLQRYLAADHVAGQQSLLDQNLNRLGHRRRVRAAMIDFFSIGAAVERTDLVATLALGTAQQLTRITNTVILPPPFKLAFTYYQVWHSRNDSDTSHKWLRDVVQSVCAQSKRGTANAFSD